MKLLDEVNELDKFGLIALTRELKEVGDGMLTHSCHTNLHKRFLLVFTI